MISIFLHLCVPAVDSIAPERIGHASDYISILCLSTQTYFQNLSLKKKMIALIDHMNFERESGFYCFR